MFTIINLAAPKVARWRGASDPLSEQAFWPGRLPFCRLALIMAKRLFRQFQDLLLFSISYVLDRAYKALQGQAPHHRDLASVVRMQPDRSLSPGGRSGAVAQSGRLSEFLPTATAAAMTAVLLLQLLSLPVQLLL